MSSQILKATITGHLYGSLWQNVIHFHDKFESDSQFQDLATNLSLQWAAFVAAKQPRDVVWQLIEIRSATQPAVAPYTLNIVRTGAGGGSDQLEPCAAFILQLRTGVAGPSNRGRIYVPGFSYAFYRNGTMAPEGFAFWADQLNNIYQNYVNDISANRFLLVVKHPAGFTPVTQVTLGTQAGYLRSRRIGVGI